MIKVKPEGRDGVWIADKDSVVDYLLGYESDIIHNFLNNGAICIGADWNKESVIEDVKQADRIAILTGDPQRHNLNHALSVIINNQLKMFDIGEITEDDLQVMI